MRQGKIENTRGYTTYVSNLDDDSLYRYLRVPRIERENCHDDSQSLERTRHELKKNVIIGYLITTCTTLKLHI